MNIPEAKTVEVGKHYLMKMDDEAAQYVFISSDIDAQIETQYVMGYKA